VNNRFKTKLLRKNPSKTKTADSKPHLPRRSNDRADDPGERIQKVLARGGVASRREIETWIQEGRLRINGIEAKLGDRLKPGDRLQLNGRPVQWEKYAEQPPRVLIYHKPIGEVVTRRDPEGRPTIFTQLPALPIGRWITVGRLDINTQGLLLVTNHGELANRLMHPGTEIEREYAVRILGTVSDEMLVRLKQGVELEDGVARFDDIVFSGGEGVNKWYHVIVREGRNRLVRRLWESQGVTVSRLIRVRYGPVALPERLKAHTFHELDEQELQMLLKFAGVNSPKTAAKASEKRKHAPPYSRNRKQVL
jgi:23S rRNA pseudouridine2605 synthase